jgi:mannose-6-phosphate isomerase-like protein (cupin superfamily)
MQDLSHYEKDVRPWGEYERFTLNEQTTVKILTIKAGEAFSLQTHEHRSEFWRVISGSGTVVAGQDTRSANPGDTFFIPSGAKHRIQGGASDLVVLEIAFGDFDEGDVKRLEDKYGRV